MEFKGDLLLRVVYMKTIKENKNTKIADIAGIPLAPTNTPIIIANRIPKNGILTNISNK